jgi:hypothetical protein
MLSITSNLKDVTSSLIGRLKAVADPNGEVRDKMLRTIAFDTAANMKVRIHQDGKNSEDTAIGEYSNSYIKIREKNRRGTDKKVILSLTRQMENDYGIVGGNGATGYSLGFKNPDNANKLDWLQNGTKSATVKEHTRTLNGKSYKVSSHTRKGRTGYGDVYKPTDLEVAHMRVVAEQFITDILNGETA